MTTLEEHVLAKLDKGLDQVIATLSEWSLACMVPLRTKDIDCKTSIKLVTSHTISRILTQLELDPKRPWTSLVSLEKIIADKISWPLQDKIYTLEKRIDTLEGLNQSLQVQLREAQLLLDTREKGRSFFGSR